jgi:hypothetical protein
VLDHVGVEEAGSCGQDDVEGVLGAGVDVAEQQPVIGGAEVAVGVDAAILDVDEVVADALEDEVTLPWPAAFERRRCRASERLRRASHRG